jgi:hypothetical protein
VANGGAQNSDRVLGRTMTHWPATANPAARYLEGGKRLAAGMTSGLADALMAGPKLMGGVMEGRVDPNSGDAVRRSLDAASLAVGGAPRTVRYASRAAENLASRSARIYDPPEKSPRAFAADYPGVQGNVGDRLTTDIEGRPLAAERVVGRRTVGGADEALSPAGIDAVATQATGSEPQAAARRLLRGNAGQFAARYDSEGRPYYNILVDRLLPGADQDKVLAHEVGHAADYFASNTQGIPHAGVTQQLRTVYNDLNNPDLAPARTRDSAVDLNSRAALRNFGPDKHGYKGVDVPRELWAEAIRAYMVNPNYLKTVAPNVAARIREYVNANERLSKIIQFNALGGGAVIGAGAAAPKD